MLTEDAQGRKFKILLKINYLPLYCTSFATDGVGYVFPSTFQLLFKLIMYNILNKYKNHINSII